ncbi:pyrimidine 5'-nucleotidase [Roseinatronobacter sp. NSM]|uniref:pyrimidine 5'-nucleotidase n=1 Tax=Roseinatronobacter sp. NSM TaxID=3457785 RepID=UPI0040370744
MVSSSFNGVRGWVFDLDNTLYPPEIRLFDQIEKRMVAFVMQELKVDHAAANQLRRDYWATYGTTLAGLMRKHDMDPVRYLQDVHDIDFSVIAPDPELRNRISNLPGRKIVYTNGSRGYAHKVLEARGLAGIFDAVYGVENANYQPKPERAAFEHVFGLDGLDISTAAMFEDDPRNLAAPYAMGMRTVHVAPAPHDAPFIHHHTDNLTGFLAQLS